MSWINRLFAVTPGFGSPVVNDALFQSVGNALATSTTVTLGGTGTSAFFPTISKGYIRVKIYNATASWAATTFNVVLNDGTQYVIVSAGAPVNGITLRNTVAGTAVGGAHGTMTLNSKVLTDTTDSPFTPSMVGANISVSAAGNAGGSLPLNTTIASYQSATQVTLAAACLNSSGVTTSTMKLTGSYFTGGSDSAPAGIDITIPFESHLALQQLDVVVASSAGTASMDVEVSGTV